MSTKNEWAAHKQIAWNGKDMWERRAPALRMTEEETVLAT